MKDPNEYFENNLKPVLQPLFLSLLSDSPEDIVSYSINWLRKKGDITSEGLTIKEKEELSQLRQQSQKINEFNSESEIFEEDNTSSEIENEDKKMNVLKKFKPRQAICGDIYNIVHNFIPTVKVKTQFQKDFLKTCLVNSFLFSSLDLNELNIIIDTMEIQQYKKGEVIIKQGTRGDCLYLVSSGEFLCYKIFSTGEEKLVKVYEKGEIFGELSLMYDSPRGATIITNSDNAYLWKLNRQSFSQIVIESAVKKREKYSSFIEKVEIFSTMDKYEVLQICDAFYEISFPKGDFVITEGEISDYFYIILEGKANALKKINGENIIVERYKEGGYFGELALIKDEPRNASIVAISVSII